MNTGSISSRQASFCVKVTLLFIATALLASCGATSSFDTHSPKFLVAVSSETGANFEVFPVNSSTGALGAAVSGSPFDLNVALDGPYAVATHPTHGNWVYVCDWHGDPLSKVVAIKLAEDGKPTVINTAETSTSYGCDYTYSMVITPNGKYLYTADYNSTKVSMFAIDQNDGHLTSLGAFTTGLTVNSDAVAASDQFVFANNGDDQIAVLTIGSNGTLSCPTSGCPVTTVTTTAFSAMAVDRSGKYLFAGTDGNGSNAQVHAFSIGTNGSLTALQGSPVTLTSGQWVGQLTFSLDNTFLYVGDGGNSTHGSGVYAFSFNASNGAVSAVNGSPYKNYSGNAPSIAVDPSNGFLYASDDWEDLFGWKRDQTTGALTAIGPADQPLVTSTAGSVSGVSVTF